MRKPEKLKNRFKAWLSLFFIATVLIAPIAAYIFTFGTQITGNHARWGEMGSALSGIYTPILSLLTLTVLLAQVRFQAEMNKHAFDQSFVQEARGDVHYYLAQMAQEFTKEFDDGSEVGRMLIESFGNASIEELRGPKWGEIAKELNKRNHRLMAVWTAYYSLLSALQVNKHSPYAHNFEGAKQKAIVMLSYEGCAALDRFTWCVTQGRLAIRHEFATDIPEQEPRKV
jgi:hypothetical protein